MLMASSFYPHPGWSAEAADRQEVTLKGVVKLGREVKIYNYKVIKGNFRRQSAKCISAMMPPGYDEVRGFGKRKTAIIEGVVMQYGRWVMSDPAQATISPMQNTCGGDYFVYIRRIKFI